MGITCSGRTVTGGKGGVVPYIKEMYACSQVQYRVEGRHVESLWVKGKGENSQGMSWWASAVGHQTRRKRWTTDGSF